MGASLGNALCWVAVAVVALFIIAYIIGACRKAHDADRHDR